MTSKRRQGIISIMNSLLSRIKLAVKLLSICLVAIGLLFIYMRATFYSSSKIAIGVITKVGMVTQSNCYRGCYLSREVTISFQDSENRHVTDIKEYFTGTLVSGILSVGSKVNVLYKPTQVKPDILDFLVVKNIGTPAYTVELYTWHYWIYPVLLILSGPLLFLFYKRWSEDNTI